MDETPLCSIIGCKAFATEKHHVFRPSSLRIWVCSRHHGKLHGVDGWDARLSVLVSKGLAKAKENGQVLGNPRIREPEVRQAMKEARDAKYFAALVAGSKEWLPLVRKMREGGNDWPAVADAVGKKLDDPWTAERLRRSVKRLVAAGMADKALLTYAPWKSDPRRDGLVRIIKSIGKGRTFAQIARHMEGLGELTPRGSTKWHPSSVRNLLKSKRAPSRLPSPPVSARQHSLRL